MKLLQWNKVRRFEMITNEEIEHYDTPTPPQIRFYSLRNLHGYRSKVQWNNKLNV